MQWSPDRNAGFSKANPQQLYLPITIDPEYHYEAINVENQQKNLSSLLWWTRRVIAMRKNFRAFSRGSLEFLFPENTKVLAFLRRHEDETILVVVNLSRFSQAAELDLSRFAGCALMEMFSQNYFPAIRKSPYVITLGPHSHYWFVLRSETAASRASKERTVPVLDLAPNVMALLRYQSRPDRAGGFARLPAQLPLVWGQGANHSADANRGRNFGVRRWRRGNLVRRGKLYRRCDRDLRASRSDSAGRCGSRSANVRRPKP